MEVVLLAMVAWAPWPLASVRPVFEYYLYLGVGVLLALWAARWLISWQVSWQKCPLIVGLGVLLLTGLWQLTPLPPAGMALLSPGTRQLLDEFGRTNGMAASGESSLVQPAGNALSLYPEGTRTELIRLLAVWLVFAVVRNNLSSPGHLRRLSYVVTANCVLLALFALVQFFSAPHGTLFWKYPTIGGVVFGPFINRSHFAFYLNLGIGLACGLLLASPVFAEARRRAVESANKRQAFRREDSGAPTPAQILQDGHAVWMIFILALLIGTTFFSLSRAGVISLVATLLLGVVVQHFRYRRMPRLGMLGVLAGLTMILLLWLGVDRVQDRLATLWKSDSYQGGRFQLWKDNLGVVAAFPVWGTGFGTYAYVEPLGRSDWLKVAIQAEHADNDYVEALVEGGLVRLLVSLALIALVYRLGWRALRRFAGGATEGLIVGALLAFTTCALQAGADFGLHLPAIALLVTVVAAQLAGLGAVESAYASRGTAGSHLNGAVGSYRFRAGGLAPVLGTATLLILGLVVIGQGRAAERADRYRLAALRVLRARDGKVWDQQIAFLKQSVALRPGDANLQVDLADAYYNRYKERRGQDGAVFESPETIAANAWLALGSCAGMPGPGAVLNAVTQATMESLLTTAGRADLLAALQAYRRALLLNPLQAKPHVRFAVHSGLVSESDQRVSLERAKRLLRNDPELWYFAGIQEMKDGRPGDALASWRRSLTHSDQYLPDILERSLGVLKHDDDVAALLPDDPRLLVKAAEQLATTSASNLEGGLLVRAADLLRAQARPTAEDYYLRARVELKLERLEDSLKAYDRALVVSPRQSAWRLEYARLLHRNGRLRETRRELILLLGLEPGNTQARDLLEAVDREIAEKL